MHFLAGVGNGETPLNLRSLIIACRLPRADRRLHRRGAVNPAVQALAPHHGDLDFGHVKPAAVLRGVVKLELAKDAACFLRGEGLVQRRTAVSAEVVEHHPDHSRVCVMQVDQVSHLVSEVPVRPLVGDIDVTPAYQRLDQHEQIDGTATPVLVIHAAAAAALRRHGQACLPDELVRDLIKANHGTKRVVVLLIEVEHVLHPVDEVPAYRRDAPLFLLPGLDVVFFRSRRTVSSVIDSITFNSISRSARSCIVHRVRPSGGSLQARATRKASCLPVSSRAFPGLGRSLSARSNPSSTNRFRVRSTVDRPSWSASAISSSVRSRSASSRIRARFTRRTRALPPRISWRSESRSASARSTTYFLAIRPPRWSLRQMDHQYRVRPHSSQS